MSGEDKCEVACFSPSRGAVVEFLWSSRSASDNGISCSSDEPESLSSAVGVFFFSPAGTGDVAKSSLSELLPVLSCGGDASSLFILSFSF